MYRIDEQMGGTNFPFLGEMKFDDVIFSSQWKEDNS